MVNSRAAWMQGDSQARMTRGQKEQCNDQRPCHVESLPRKVTNSPREPHERRCHMIPDTFDSNTWWSTQMHGGEPNPYMVGSPHTWWPGQPAGQLWWGARPLAGPARPPGPHPTWPPTKDGLMPGQATMYVGSPPCMGSVPHHAFGFPTMHFNQRSLPLPLQNNNKTSESITKPTKPKTTTKPTKQ